MKAQAEKLDAASQANYKAAEDWKAAALENYRIGQENYRVAESNRLLAEQRGGTSSIAPLPAYTLPPAPVYQPRPKPTTTVIHSAGQGVYTTHGAGGGATIIETVPGVWEIRHKDGTMQRVLKP